MFVFLRAQLPDTLLWTQQYCFNTILYMVTVSDVTKLVKIGIRRMRILTFKIRRMRMRIESFIISVGT